jgi:hypothetical protein
MGASARVEIQRRLRGHRPPCTALRHNSPIRKKHLEISPKLDSSGDLHALGNMSIMGNS